MKKLTSTVFSVICAICILFSTCFVTNVVKADDAGSQVTFSTTAIKKSIAKDKMLLVTAIKNVEKVWEIGYLFDGDVETIYKTNKTYYTHISTETKTWTAEDIFGADFAGAGMIIWEIAYNNEVEYGVQAYAKTFDDNNNDTGIVEKATKRTIPAEIIGKFYGTGTYTENKTISYVMTGDGYSWDATGTQILGESGASSTFATNTALVSGNNTLLSFLTTNANSNGISRYNFTFTDGITTIFMDIANAYAVSGAASRAGAFIYGIEINGNQVTPGGVIADGGYNESVNMTNAYYNGGEAGSHNVRPLITLNTVTGTFDFSGTTVQSDELKGFGQYGAKVVIDFVSSASDSGIVVDEVFNTKFMIFDKFYGTGTYTENETISHIMAGGGYSWDATGTEIIGASGARTFYRTNTALVSGNNTLLSFLTTNYNTNGIYRYNFTFTDGTTTIFMDIANAYAVSGDPSRAGAFIYGIKINGTQVTPGGVIADGGYNESVNMTNAYYNGGTAGSHNVRPLITLNTETGTFDFSGTTVTDSALVGFGANGASVVIDFVSSASDSGIVVDCVFNISLS